MNSHENPKFKKCSKCKQIKLTTEFYRNKSKKSGLESSCKVCVKAAATSYRKSNLEKVAAREKRYRKNNPEKVAAGKKRYRENNLEKVRAAIKCWRKNNPEKIAAKNRRYRENNLEKVVAKNKRYRENNFEKIAASDVRWRKNNPEKVAAKARRYQERHSEEIAVRARCWRKNNPEKVAERNKLHRLTLKGNLNSRMAGGIYKSLKGGKAGKSWEVLVGFGFFELKERLKRTIPEGFTWQDLMDGKLHIDHIIPISAFNFEKPEHADFRRCWALSNLQLLPARENLRKSAKLTRPFQPSLALG